MKSQNKDVLLTLWVRITDAKFCHVCGVTNGTNEDSPTLSVLEAALALPSLLMSTEIKKDKNEDQGLAGRNRRKRRVRKLMKSRFRSA